MSRPELKPGRSVRALAARLNARIVSAGASLDAVLPEGAGLPRRDAALLRALLSGSLRWHHRLQWQAGRLLDRPLKPRETVLAALLRVGLFQLQGMRIPDHAAVSATVEAAEGLGLGRARGLVNAVLRRYLREREALDREMAGNEPARTSHPQWLIDAIRADWPADWQHVLEANNSAPPMWLRVNRRELLPARYLEHLAAQGMAATVTERAPDAVLLSEPCPVERLPGFGQGHVSVQDAAAQLAAGLMRLARGQRVLDACAAPGGKTAHMLETCPDLAELVALDSDAGRLERVAENLDRLGLAARLVHADARRIGDWWDGEPFDRILLDAPCSGTGVIRRHPDIKILRRPEDVESLSAIQAELLAGLWPLLKPGGLLVYATCSVLARENSEATARFIASTDEAVCPAFGGAGHFQVLPGEANMDGFYYACLRKGAEQQSNDAPRGEA